MTGEERGRGNAKEGGRKKGDTYYIYLYGFTGNLD